MSKGKAGSKNAGRTTAGGSTARKASPAGGKGAKGAKVPAGPPTAKKRRRFSAGMVVVAVLLLAVGAGVGVQYWRSNSGVSVAANRAPEPPVITAPGTDGQGVTVGRKGAGTHIDLYLDYRCPHCKDFEEEAGDTIGKLVDDGTATVTYHPMTFVNPKASPRIANAFACAAAAGKTRAYNDELYAGYSKAWSTQQLLELGSELRISDPAFAQCVRADGQAKWLESVGRAAAARGVNSTPTVFVDGKKLAEDQLTPDGIRAAAGARS